MNKRYSGTGSSYEATSVVLDQLMVAGIAAGDIHVAVVREIERTLEKARGSAQKATRIALDRLEEMNLISVDDLKNLDAIYIRAFAAERGKISPDQAFAEVRAIYLNMVAARLAYPADESTQVALAIASGVSGAFVVGQTPVDLPPGTLAISKGTAAGVGTLAGIAVGAVVGGVIGGGAGAVIGAVVGGIAGGAVGLCAGEDEPDPSGSLDDTGGPAEPAPTPA